MSLTQNQLDDPFKTIPNSPAQLANGFGLHINGAASSL
jgi:hypothetical protein